MYYFTLYTKQDCTAQSDREISCTLPAIAPDLLDGIINGTLELRYSLVAASVPGLDNLHLMSQFVIEFVDDPVITPFNETLSYQPESNVAIMIIVSVLAVYMYHSHVHTHTHTHTD